MQTQYNTTQHNTMHIFNPRFVSLLSAICMSFSFILHCGPGLHRCCEFFDVLPSPSSVHHWLYPETCPAFEVDKISYSIHVTCLFSDIKIEQKKHSTLHTLLNNRIHWNQGAVPTLPVASATSTLATWKSTSTGVVVSKGAKNKQKLW